MNVYSVERINVDYSMEALCTRILERHRNRIRTQKPHLAVLNLARIVDATLRLANRKGFHATSLRDLAQESGLSMGGLYSYFDTKDTLLLMILGEVATSVVEVLDAPPTSVQADPMQHLRWLIFSHIELTEKMLPWFVFSYMEAKSFPVQGKNIAVESELVVEKIFATVLEHGTHSGIFTVANPMMSAALIKPLLQDWYVKRSKYRKRGVDWHNYASEVAAFVERSLLA